MSHSHPDQQISHLEAMRAYNPTPEQRIRQMLGMQNALARPADEIPQAQLDDLLEACHIPILHWNHQPTEAEGWRRCVEALRARPRGSLLVVCGGRGVGKTQAAIEVTRPLLRSGRRAIYVTPIELAERLSASRRWKSEESEVDVMNELTEARLLIVDECGRGAMSLADGDRLCSLLDRRYRAMKTSVLLTNLEPEALLENLGEMVMSRVNECGGVIACDWPSFRGEG